MTPEPAARAGSPVETSAAEWHRRIWHLAGPLILSNLAVPLLGAVDTAVVGHLPGPVPLGAVAVGAMILSFLYWGFGFLRMGTTGFTAQAWGAGDAAELRATLARALLLAGAIGLAAVALQGPIAWAAFALVEGSAEVEALAARYFAIRIWGVPAALANFVLWGWLLGVRRVRAMLVLQFVLNGLNIVLDLVFVLGFGWGVAGVAFATLVSEYTALAVGLALAARALARTSPAPDGWKRARILDRRRLVALVRVNGDIFVRSMCLMGAFAAFTALGARMGDAVLAANALLIQFQHFTAFGLDGFAHAAEALVGGAIGGRRRADYRGAVRASTLWAGLVALAYTAVYLALGTTLVDALTDVAAVREAAYAYLPWVVLLPVVSVWSFQLDGIFIGATRTPEMRNGMILSLAVFAGAAYVLIPLWGNHGLWLSLTLFMAARGVTLGLWLPRIAHSLA